MKRMKFTLFLVSLTIALTAFAQDAIHGVDGYYNWTPKQLKADNILKASSHTWVGPFRPSIVYNDNSVTYYMGANGTVSGSVLKFRTDFGTNFNATNPLRITKKFPVIAIKMGLPDSTVAYGYGMQFILNWKYNGDSAAVTGTTAGVSNSYLESSQTVTNFWYQRDSTYKFLTGGFSDDVKTGKVLNGTLDGSFGHGAWGTNPNGRMYFVASNSTFGNGWGYKDSTYTWTATGPQWIKKHEYTYSYYGRLAQGDKVTRVTTGNQTQSTLNGVFRVDDSEANNIFYINLEKVFQRDSAKFHINRDLFIYAFGNVFENAGADTLKTIFTYDEVGNVTGTQRVAKTKEELPQYRIKWIKTFPSVEALKLATAINAGDGNDTRSDNQLILNSALYYAKKALQNYAYSDPIYHDAYQTAFDNALAIYQTTAPNEDKTSQEWLAWDAGIAQAITDLATAKNEFLKGITANLTNPYNKIKTGNGEAELLIGASTTINNIPCKLITMGGQGSGSPFVMVKSASLVNGRTAYTLSNAYGRVCVIRDTLALVPTAKLASASTALFVFSNRSDKDFPAYDVYVNGKFMYLNNTTGKLGFVTDVPDGEISELGAYLFDIEASTYDASGDDLTKPIFDAWEFENSSLNGWEINNYRRYSTIENKLIDNKGCMTLGVQDTYYAGSDTLNLTLLNTDYLSTGGAGPSYRRENGTYPNSARLEPVIGGVDKRDSTWIIYTNPFQKRYLAIKWAATAPTVAINTFTLYAVKTIDEVTFTPTNSIANKGSVMYWDMLANGVPYGVKGWSCQYIGTTGFTNSTQKLYIDWVKTYATVDEIPNELLDVHSDVENPVLNDVLIFSADKKVIVRAQQTVKVQLFNVSGIEIATRTGVETNFTVPVKGAYIVRISDASKVVSGKVIVQ